MLVYFVVNPVTSSESESASLQGSARKGMLVAFPTAITPQISAIVMTIGLALRECA